MTKKKTKIFKLKGEKILCQNKLKEKIGPKMLGVRLLGGLCAGDGGVPGAGCAPTLQHEPLHVPPRARCPCPGGLEVGLPCALDSSSSPPAVRLCGLPQAQVQQPGVWNGREGSCCPLEALCPAEAGHGDGRSDADLPPLQASAHALPKRSLSSIASTVLEERNSAHFRVADANSQPQLIQ